jgi:hypothetical protein
MRDDLFQSGKARLPAEFSPGFLAIGYQDRGVSRSAVLESHGDLAVRHPMCRVDDFLYRKSGAVAEVEHVALTITQ